MSQRNDSEHAEHVAKLRELIGEAHICMFTTVDTDGKPWSRPMALQSSDFDGDLWFFTNKGEAKIDHIQRNRKVGVAIMRESDQAYVTLAGTALVVHDDAKAEELWSEPLRAWFPGGPSSDDLCLLKVTVTRAEYWDSPSSVLVHAFGYAKAVLTGQASQGELSEHGKVDL